MQKIFFLHLFIIKFSKIKEFKKIHLSLTFQSKISSIKRGFIPTKADLVKKDCNFDTKLQSFFVSNLKS